MTNVNNNYSNSEALLKRLQMKGLMDEKKEDVQNQPEGSEEQETPKPECSENNAGSLQALDYQALMNSTLFKNNAKAQENGFKTYSLTSKGTSITINGEEILVTGKGKFEIAVEGNNVVIKAGKNASNIKFKNTQDLNITVEKSTVAFDLTTGAGNDTVIIAEGAKVKNVNTGAGDDTVLNFGTATNINTGNGADAVLNKGTVSTSISTGAGKDIIQNDGKAGNIYGGAGDDRIVNNGKVSKKIDGQQNTDVIIDGNTVKFEKAANNIPLGENDNAIINADGSVTVTTKDFEANKETIVNYDKTGTEVSREEKALNSSSNNIINPFENGVLSIETAAACGLVLTIPEKTWIPGEQPEDGPIYTANNTGKYFFGFYAENGYIYEVWNERTDYEPKLIDSFLGEEAFSISKTTYKCIYKWRRSKNTFIPVDPDDPENRNRLNPGYKNYESEIRS